MSAEQLGNVTAPINGIRLDRVAAIVSGKPPLDATRAEHEIAEAVCKYGAKLEQQGYLPAMRRPAMYRKMVELARLRPVPALDLRSTAALGAACGLSPSSDPDGEE